MADKNRVHIYTQYVKRPQPAEDSAVTTECGETIPFIIAESVPNAKTCARCQIGLSNTLAMTGLDDQSVYHIAEQ